jgi:phage terminase large subunit-like protein
MSRRKPTPSISSSGRAASERLTDAEILANYGLRATQYAEEVVSGKLVNGMWARLACQRHLDNLAASRRKTFGYRFDHLRAGRFLYFLEQLPHVDGNWGSPTIKAEDWQCFVFGSVYGWLEKETQLRRFIKAYLSVARKNAKTTTLLGAGFYGMVLDSETGAQVYNGANKMEQAKLLFDPAQAMMAKAPGLFQRLGLKIRGAKCILGPNNCRWRPVTKSPGDGGGASTWIQDEFHEALSDKLTNTIVDGMGARDQPLAWFITTAGDNIGGPCYSYELQIHKILQGTITLESTFGMIYAPDMVRYVDPFGKECEPDDWTSLAAVQKANPNWGISVVKRTFLAQFEEAKQDAAKQNTFKTKRLNIWCNAAVGYFNLQDWNGCANPEITLEQFAGRPSILGVDLASKVDLCSIARVFRVVSALDPDEEELAHYYIFWRHYQNAGQVERKENTHWAKWVAEGRLIQTEGNITDYRWIYRDLKADVESGNVREVCFDQRESGLLMQDLQAETGVDLFEVPQTVQYLSEPLKWLQALMISRRLHHVGCPLVTWSVSNVTAKPDHNENVFPRHAGDKHELKIDPVSAALNALVRAREVLNQPEPLPFEVEVWS